MEVIDLLSSGKHIYGSEIRLINQDNEWYLGYCIDGCSCYPRLEWDYENGKNNEETRGVDHLIIQKHWGDE